MTNFNVSFEAFGNVGRPRFGIALLTILFAALFPNAYAQDSGAPTFVRVADHLDPPQAGEAVSQRVGMEFRSILPIPNIASGFKLRTEQPDLAYDRTINLYDVIDWAQVPEDAKTLYVAISSTFGTVHHAVNVSELSKDSGSRHLLPALPVAKLDSYARANHLGNAGFEELNQGTNLKPWQTTPYDSGKPPYAVVGQASPEGNFMLNLFRRYDGRPTKIFQVVEVVPGGDQEARLIASCEGKSDAANQLSLKVYAKTNGKEQLLGSTTHKGDGRWRKMELEAPLPSSNHTQQIRIEIERRGGQRSTASVDDFYMNVPGARLSSVSADPAIPVSVLITNSSEHTNRTKPVPLSKNARLDTGIALMAPEDDSPLKPRRFTVTAHSGRGVETIFDEVLDPPTTEAEEASWKDVRIDLAHLADQTVAFEFVTKPADVNVWSEDGSQRTNGLWGDTVVYSTDPQPRDKPNVILISLDTFRASHLGCYGYERDTSPRIDAFAEEAMLFEHCLAPSSWTTPSHASMFTGLLPSVHMAGIVGGTTRNALASRFTTIAELACEGGYMTGAITEGYMAGGQWGLDQGFGRYSNGPPPPPATIAIEDTVGKAERWLRDYGQLPFFLFVHTYAAHWPYAPPSPFASMFDDDDSDIPEPTGKDIGTANLSPEQIRLLKNRYDAGIAYTDHWVGRFLYTVERLGLMDNTIIVIVSDHGEAFMEHGSMTHGRHVYNEVLHVPLIIRIPGSTGGARISSLVAVTDMFATLADLIGVEADVPPTSYNLVPLIKPSETTETFTRGPVISELLYQQPKTLFFASQTPEFKYVVESGYATPGSILLELLDGEDLSGEQLQNFSSEKVVQFLEFLSAPSAELDPAKLAGQGEQLYNLTQDPVETKNLAPDDPDRLRELRAKGLEAFAKAVASIAAPGRTDSPAAPLSEEEKEGLRALGYAE